MLKNLKAIFFDLDGTLVDSKLDFDLMRSDLGFPYGVPILEHIETLSDQSDITNAHQVVIQHEVKGAQESVLYEGVREILMYLKTNSIPTAILTRNCREATQITLDKFNIEMTDVITREDFPAKPNPSALLHLAKINNIDPKDAAYIGDFEFDLQASKNAGMKAGLFMNDKNQYLASEADFTFSCYHELLKAL